MKPEGQKVPIVKDSREVGGVGELEVGHQNTEQDEEQNQGHHDVQGDGSCHGQSEQSEGEDEEHAGQVDQSEPSVLRGDVAQCSRH